MTLPGAKLRRRFGGIGPQSNHLMPGFPEKLWRKQVYSNPSPEEIAVLDATAAIAGQASPYIEQSRTARLCPDRPASGQPHTGSGKR